MYKTLVYKLVNGKI